jgi:hypothetical protein
VDVVTPGHQASDGSKTKLFKLAADLRFRSLFSWGGKLSIKNMEGVIILRLDFTKLSLGAAYKWWVQIPDGRGHRTVGFSNSRKSKSWDTGIDLTIDNLVRDGAPITIHITQPRSDIDVYHATVDGIVVARATIFKAGLKFEFSS